MQNGSRVSPLSYIYFTLFLISGVSGLIYESVWSQYLKQFLGHAAYSQTLVLVIYMGGMAAGAWIAAAGAVKYRNLLLGYAIVEIILGAMALVFHDVFIRYIDVSFTTVIPFLGKPLPIALYKWVSASLIILPQSMLLGATFPLMAGGILRRFPGLSGYKMSFIYFVNTLGASIGVLISGFYLVKQWGLRGAIISGGVIDLFVGFAILALCLNDKSALNSAGNNSNNAGSLTDNGSDDINNGIIVNNNNNAYSAPPIPRNNIDIAADIDDIEETVKIDLAAVYAADIDNTDAADAATVKNAGGQSVIVVSNKKIIVKNKIKKYDRAQAKERREYYFPLLFISGATAAASFIYEIGWIRMLSLVLGSSTHSFELMLSAFILGLALGSFFVRNKLDAIKNAPRFLGIAQIAMGATAIITLFTYGNMFHFMVFILDGLQKSMEGYILFNVTSHIICMIIMLPTTICAGMVIPLIIHMLYKRGYGEQAIGKVYAVNTAGGIVGVALAVWVLMELVGLKYLIIIGAVIDMGIGLYVLYKFRETQYTFARMAALPACILFLTAALAFGKVDPVFASSGVFRYGSISKSKRIVEHRDGKTASITLFRNGGNLVLSTNGKPDASVGTGDDYSSDEYTMALLGVLPLSIHDSARTAAVIGMGAGMTAHFMLYDNMLEQLDVVEIERAMVKLAKRIGPKVENTFNDPRCRIHIEDAKTFFSAQNRSYDIIVSEPSNPWVSGVSSLFSREFFSNIRNHLNSGGILMQWFHSYEADITILVSILKALGESFPVYDMYMVGSDLLIIAAKDEGTDISVKRDIFINAPMAESLFRMGFSGIEDFKQIRLAGSDLFGPLVHTYPTPPNSDYHPYVDLHAVKYRFLNHAVSELSELWDFIIPVNRIIATDTGYLRLSPLESIPDMYNLREIQRAKALAHEIIINAHRSPEILGEAAFAPGSTFIIDYAAANPGKVKFEQVQSSIIQILQKTLPFLSAEEMREIWEIIEQKMEYAEFSEEEMLWVDYFRALCAYDLPALRQLSLELLPEGEFDGYYTNNMLLASLLASSSALGDTAQLEQIWNRYTDRKAPPVSIRAVRAMLGLGD